MNVLIATYLSVLLVQETSDCTNERPIYGHNDGGHDGSHDESHDGLCDGLCDGRYDGTRDGRYDGTYEHNDDSTR